MNRCCKTCKWARWDLTPKGRIRRNVSGRCDYPWFQIPPGPECEIRPQPNRIGIWPNMGSECRVWEKKGGGQ